MSRMVNCAEHRPVRPAFVCGHLLKAQRDGVARGLIWTRDEDGHVGAYCDLCDRLLAQAGGEWTEEVEGGADITLICEMCFDTIERINAAAGLRS